MIIVKLKYWKHQRKNWESVKNVRKSHIVVKTVKKSIGCMDIQKYVKTVNCFYYPYSTVQINSFWISRSSTSCLEIFQKFSYINSMQSTMSHVNEQIKNLQLKILENDHKQCKVLLSFQLNYSAMMDSNFARHWCMYRLYSLLHYYNYHFHFL